MAAQKIAQAVTHRALRIAEQLAGAFADFPVKQIRADAAHIRAETQLVPGAGDTDRHADAVDVGLTALTFERADRARVEIEIDRTGQDVRLALTQEADQRVQEPHIVRLQNAVLDEERGAQLGEVGLLIARLDIVAGQVEGEGGNRFGRAADELSQINAEQRPVIESKLTLAIERIHKVISAAAPGGDIDFQIADPCQHAGLDQIPQQGLSLDDIEAGPVTDGRRGRARIDFEEQLAPALIKRQFLQIGLKAPVL